MSPPSSKGIDSSALARRLRREVRGDVLFDALSRGRYSTDASIYQIKPLGVVVPRTTEDVVRTVRIAGDAGVPILARGGGTSQAGQAVNAALVVDTSKHLNQVLDFDAGSRTVRVQPGIVLDALNRWLARHGVFFPIDPSTASRATIGGMAGNNSCGARSIRYRNTVHNVRAIDAVTADGASRRFAEVPAELERLDADPAYHALVAHLRTIAAREDDEMQRRWPKLLRRVGGYNLDTLSPRGHNLAQLLVGSEGTLAFFTALELEVQPLPPYRVLGVCHFPTFRRAMEATAPIVELAPSAVELVDRNVLDLARAHPAFGAIVERHVRGSPAALLLVEFSGEDAQTQRRQLDMLEALMGDLGLAEAVVRAEDSAAQSAIWELRKAGLNIVQSMKGDAKPLAFIEDCAVPLEHLADYTERLNEVFARHGTSGTWYGHASVGCLHVRPILNLKEEAQVGKMRAIAEETMALVRAYKGSHSGEHGDGIVRAEFHEQMFGPRLVRAFEEVKDAFDPRGLLNPGRVVRAPRMDERPLLRHGPGYAPQPVETTLDWSDWGDWLRATEMCNNNGACRKAEPGVMCPSYRVTRDEQHVTRGRANSLRLALSGALGPRALTSEAMAQTLALCVSCKGCRRECPTGVDMARMKIEFLHHYRNHHGLSLRDRLVAYLPRYAARAARYAALLNLGARLPGARTLAERALSVSARRSLPRWRRDVFQGASRGSRHGRAVALFVDTFNRYFEPENARAALAVLTAAGYDVRLPHPLAGERPLCCGRTFLAVGLVDEARREARRLAAALESEVGRGTPVVGLEPSCLFTLRDEYAALLPRPDARALGEHALLLEEFLAAEHDAGRLALGLGASPWRRALVHGHCHQKAFEAMPALERTLHLIPDLQVEVLDSGCCGMAGAFGFEAEHYDVSMRMGELALLPAARSAARDTVIVANGTSCRHQIRDGAGRTAWHSVRLLQSVLAP
jgi:FAD/FMN-containing dehydrogenase/Fe-S oxidoreductase